MGIKSQGLLGELNEIMFAKCIEFVISIALGFISTKEYTGNSVNSVVTLT